MNHCPRLIASVCVSICLYLPDASARADASPPGIFQTNSDVGAPLHAGSVQYDPAKHSYLVTGGGANMWATNDDFQFVWKKVSGDVSLAADIALAGTEGDAHRKACLMIRQTLDPDSAYADAALHGNGLTALQHRAAKGAITREVQPKISAPVRLRIEKHGDTISLSVAAAGEKLQSSVEPIQLHLDSPFYIGLAVCAHDNKTVRQAVFTRVELREEKPAPEK